MLAGRNFFPILTNILFVFIALASPCFCDAPQLVWSIPDPFNGPNGSWVYHTQGFAMDASGDLYVGSTHDDNIALTKYSRSGEPLWTKQWGGLQTDYVGGLALDSFGNIYVTGWTYSIGWLPDYSGTPHFGAGYLLKLSNEGNTLWTRFLGERFYPSDIAIDQNENPVIAGPFGRSSYSYFQESARVMKLDGSGNTLWSYALDDIVNSQCSVAIDPANNVIVGGDTVLGGWVSGGYDTIFDGSLNLYGFPITDGFILKLSPDGLPLWSTYIGGTGRDQIACITTDPAGNVYAAGATSSPNWAVGGGDTTYAGGDRDGFIIKLTGAGTFLWSSYSGKEDTDYAYDIVIDSEGIIHLAAVVFSPGHYMDFLLMQWSATGTQISQTAFDFDYAGYQIAVDEFGNIFSFGASLSRFSTASGSLQLTLEPAEARAQGAQWRPSGTLDWHDSGETIPIPAGHEGIEFKSIDGWDVPENFQVTILAGQLTSQIVTFDGVGSIQVILEPAIARARGARWRRVGTTLWRGSQYTEHTLPPGIYAIEFRDLAGWEIPSNATVTVEQGALQTLTETYLPQSGILSDQWVLYP